MELQIIIQRGKSVSHKTSLTGFSEVASWGEEKGVKKGKHGGGYKREIDSLENNWSVSYVKMTTILHS